MNFKTTVVLVALLVIVAALWLLVPSRQEAAPPAAPTPATARKIFDPPPNADAVVRVELARPDAPTLVFERIRDETPAPARGLENWRIVAPLSSPAESYKVRGLITALNELESLVRFEAGAPGELTAAEAGLEPPTATVTLITDDDKRHVLEIGKKAVMSSDTYVRIPGTATVHLARRDLLTQVKQDLSDFRARRLVELKPDEATALRIEHEGTTYDLSRSPDGEWVINAPVRAWADREKVRALLNRLNTVRAEEFIDDAPAAPAQYGLEPPFLRLTVTTETRREIQPDTAADTQPAEPQFETVTRMHGLVVGGLDLKGERRYVRPGTEAWVVSVPVASLKDLVPDLAALRDPRVTRVKAADVTELTLAVGAASTTLRKEGGVWQGTGELAQLETAAVSDLLEAFEDLRAVSYIDEPGPPAEYGLAEPRASVTVTASGAVAPVTLHIGQETESGRNAYVQRAGERTVIVTSAAQAGRLVVSPLALRSRAIFSYPVEQLRRVEVQRGPRQYELVRAGDEWRLAAPADAPLAADNARNLANDLARLRAAQVVARDEPGRYGLDQPAVRICFDVATPPPPPPDTAPATEPAAGPEEVVAHTLWIGRVDGTAYARHDEDPFIFQLDETVYRTLTAELIDPQLFDFRAELITGLTIAGPDLTLELTRDGAAWKYAPEPYLALDAARVDELATHITQLRAEEYIAYRGGDLAAAGLADAPVSVTVRVGDGREAVLKIGPLAAGELTRPAALVAEQRIFRLRNEDCEKLLRGLDAYVKAETPATPPRMP